MAIWTWLPEITSISQTLPSQDEATAEDSEKPSNTGQPFFPSQKQPTTDVGKSPQPDHVPLQHVMVIAVLGRLLPPSNILWEMSRAGGSYISFANLPLLLVWSPFSRLQPQTQEELFDSLSSA